MDKNIEIANKYNVINIRTMTMLKDDKKQDVIIGFLPKKAVKESIEKYL